MAENNKVIVPSINHEYGEDEDDKFGPRVNSITEKLIPESKIENKL